MGLFAKLFGSKESRLLLAEFRKIENELGSGATGLVRRFVKRRLRKIDPGDWVFENGLSAREIVYIEIVVASEFELEFGGHYVYRGILSTRGELFQILHAKYVRKLRESGAITDEIAREKNLVRSKIIKEGG